MSQPLHNVCFEKAETIRSTLLRIALVFFETDFTLKNKYVVHMTN